jgi:hypothetical protein
MSADVRTLARVPITFDVADGGSEHAPLVLGRFGGIVTRLVLDTGSDVHLLTKELVDQLGLIFEEGEEGTDHSGATMPSWTVEDVACVLGDAEVVLREVVAIPAPSSFPRWGIGGIVSPQHLHESAYIVIDLVRDELLFVEGEGEAVAAWLGSRSPQLSTVVLERDPQFGAIVVRGAITPYAEIPTMLNTGGRRTEFSADAVPGLAAGRSRRLGGGVSGAGVRGVEAGDATLVVAGHDEHLTSLAVRAAMPDPQGTVGMDVLSNSVLAVTADRRRPVLWQIGAAET